jgi:hypothetical protein
MEISNFELLTGLRDHRIDLERYTQLVVTGKFEHPYGWGKNFQAMYYEATEEGLDAAFIPPKANPWRWNISGIRPDGTRKRIRTCKREK